MADIAVQGIWLRSIGDTLEVLAQVDGEWCVVITEHRNGPMSHIVEPRGIAAAAPDRLALG